jgi:5-methylcytosine-specific restriction endonuclease McrBC GTP-binding regulatory subunit McrB
MKNPFNLSDEKLKELLAGYEAWLKSDPKEEKYPVLIRDQSKMIREEFLNKEVLSRMSDDELYDKIFKYSRKLEGPVQIRLGEPRLRACLPDIRRNLMYIMTSEDSPFMVAQNILDGKYKISIFAKAFWSPILLAQFPHRLPNWNNKTEKFVKKFDIIISTSRLSIAEKYQILSDVFTYLSGLVKGHDFYTINHLMHYGTEIKAGKELIEKLLGNKISDPVIEMIKMYKEKIKRVGLKDELYKWELLKKYRGRPDLEAGDFLTEIKGIDFSNLIFPTAIAVKNHIAKDLPAEFRECFINLFHDDKDLTSRVKDFMDNVLIVYRKLESKLGHHQDERTISTYLTYHNPEKYTFFKDSFYQRYCKMIGAEPKSKGEKYAHYMELVSDFRDKYILPDPKLISLVKGFMNSDCFADENHLVMVQDILYQMLDQEEPDIVDDDPTPGESVTCSFPLNMILFGPPGTGKTYNTINKALAIIENKSEGDIKSEKREIIKNRFNEYMDKHQIVFTTFHQSLSYEDFVEGIKPDVPEKEGDPVIYRIKYGVFRTLCIEASFAIAQISESKTTEEVLDFSILFDKFAESTEEKLIGGQKVELETKSGGTVMVESISQQGNFVIKHHAGVRNYTVSKTRLLKLQSAIKDLDEISNINDKFREIIGGSNSSAYWSVLNAIRKEKPYQSGTKEPRNYTFEEKKEVVLSLSNDDFKNKNGKPFVIIIDEINRGNVSQIFGELISLIEKDKRLGNPEALEVILPYSREKFGVPPNLYILGTMNTADRSIEALDTALRRRFCFEEMVPLYDLQELNYKVSGIYASDILLTINKRIEKLIDKDHLIGHSYFMKAKANRYAEKLETAFYENLIPLLQEYFYGDFGKVGLVLGKGFVSPKNWSLASNLFADFEHESASEFDEKTVYEIIDYRNSNHGYFLNIRAGNENVKVDMDFGKAIKLLMKQSIA